MSAPEPSVREWPHRYIGRPWGAHAGGRKLVHGEACTIIGRRAGGLKIKTTDGLQWVVGAKDTEKRLTDAQKAERNVSVTCPDHGALPGERCTASTRACARRKQAADRR